MTMRKRYVMDFGSEVIRLVSEDGDLSLTEPAVAALDRQTGKPVCFGQAAKTMAIRVPGSVDIIYPYTDIEHMVHELLTGMMQHLASCIGKKRGFRADLVLSYPGESGGDTEQLFLDAATDAGALDVMMVDAAYAAYRGAGAGKYADVVVMNMGASVIDMALVLNGKVKNMLSLHVGGRNYDDALGDDIYDRHALLLDDDGAEYVKNELATLKKQPEQKRGEVLFAGLKAAEDEDAGIKQPEEIEAEITGVYQTTGLLRTLSIGQRELTESMEPLFVQLAAAYGELMKGQKGLGPDDRVILTGGFAKMNGMAERISEMTGIHTEVALEPEGCVLRGMLSMIDEGEL